MHIQPKFGKDLTDGKLPQGLTIEQVLQQQYRKLTHLIQKSVPESDEFDPVALTFRHPDHADEVGDMTLTVSNFNHPSNAGDVMRTLDLRINTPSGKSNRSQYLLVDTTAKLLQFIGGSQAVAKSQEAIQDSIRSFQEHGAG